MGANSKIEWTHHTFNPWIGCQKVSPGCDHCYAEAQNAFRKWNGGTWGPHAPRKRTSDANWRQPIKWNAEAKAIGERRRVFCASLADVFDNQAPAEWRADLWALIHSTTMLDWLLLTKRPENIAQMYPGNNDVANMIRCRAGIGYWPWPNVWLGTTTEDQPNYNRRWSALAQIPCAIRFISYEPALGPLELLPPARGLADFPEWVICGGESGRDARPMNPAWERSVRDQCSILGIPYLRKQWGEWAPGEAFGLLSDEPIADRHGDVRDWMHRYVMTGDRGDRVRAHSFTKHATDLVYRIGKKRAGRLLDGVEHNGMPGNL